MQPLNEAAKEPAAAVGNCGSQLGIWVRVCHIKRKMTEDFNVVGHLSITMQSPLKDDYRRLLALPVRRRTSKMTSVLLNISIDENSE